VQRGGLWRHGRGARARAAAEQAGALLAPGDGWAGEAARFGWTRPEQITALRRVLEPDLGARPAGDPEWLGNVRALTRRENREAYAGLLALFGALADAVLVCHANTAAAVNLVWAAFEVLGETATPTLSHVLHRTLAEPWTLESGRVRNACSRALAEIDTEESVAALRTAAIDAPTKTQKEQLLLCLDLAKRAAEQPSRAAELHVPDHGLSADGRLVLHTHHREYLLTLGQSDGRVDVHDRFADATPDQAAQRVLDAQVAAIRRTYLRERLRIEALLATERVWSGHEWRRVYRDNPITRAVASRLVWRHEFTDGLVLELLPDAGGGVSYVRSDDGVCRPGTLDELFAPGAAVSLWHPRDAQSPALAAWRALRDDSLLTQPFEQIDRDFTRVEPDPDAMELNQHSSSRVAAAAFADAVTRLDWHSRRGRAGRSGDAARVVYRDFPDARLSVAVPCREEDDGEPGVVLGAGWFHRTEDRARTPLSLGYVPLRVYSEALRDLAVLARGAANGDIGVHDRVEF